MKKILVAVDMQNDFIDGVLGTKEAEAIVPAVKNKIAGFDGQVIFTRDTHGENYLDSSEGKNLPYPHCIEGTDGWKISAELTVKAEDVIFNKPTFGSLELMNYLIQMHDREGIESIVLVGLCTDICVISNAMLLKAALPEVEIIVDASCCAGVTPESHKNALNAMKMCQIKVENEM